MQQWRIILVSVFYPPVPVSELRTEVSLWTKRSIIKMSLVTFTTQIKPTRILLLSQVPTLWGCANSSVLHVILSIVGWDERLLLLCAIRIYIRIPLWDQRGMELEQPALWEWEICLKATHSYIDMYNFQGWLYGPCCDEPTDDVVSSAIMFESTFDIQYPYNHRRFMSFVSEFCIPWEIFHIFLNSVPENNLNYFHIKEHFFSYTNLIFSHKN